MTVDNSRFSYYNPGEYLDRAALAAASTEVGPRLLHSPISRICCRITVCSTCRHPEGPNPVSTIRGSGP